MRERRKMGMGVEPSGRGAEDHVDLIGKIVDVRPTSAHDWFNLEGAGSIKTTPD